MSLLTELDLFLIANLQICQPYRAFPGARLCRETSRSNARKPSRVKFPQRIRSGHVAATGPAAGHSRAPLKFG